MNQSNKIGLSMLFAGAIALAIIAVTAVSTYFLLSSEQPVAINLFGQSDEANQARFTSLDKFVISVDGDDRTHYLLLEMALKTNSDAAHEALLEFKPVAKNVLLRMFSQKSYEEVRQLKDIEALQSRVHKELAMVLVQNGYQHRIEEVLFTKMVIQ